MKFLISEIHDNLHHFVNKIKILLQPENISQDNTSHGGNDTTGVKNGNQPELPTADQLSVKQDIVVGANPCQNKDASTPAQNQYINTPTVPTLVVPSVSNNGGGEAVQCPVLPSLATQKPSPSSPPPIVIQPCPGSPTTTIVDHLGNSAPVTTAAVNGVLPSHNKAVQPLATNTSNPSEVVKEEREETLQAQAMDLSTVAQVRAPQLAGQTVQLSNKISGTIEARQTVMITSAESQQRSDLPKTITATTIKVPPIPVAKNNNDSVTATLNLNVEKDDEVTKSSN